ncbi:ABC transporter permease [Petroclostridium sp. X23]|uniref:ABC transporter permease n=1 Tax=Petroclostridium sp. X23 TaxID=3045146 RepID=UPI0024ADA5D0|nr:ABC transporter permease [Petroclostridium sp. X23]WHH57971.1 ABC transporter permease [Petroclostridium sp. X23]
MDNNNSSLKKNLSSDLKWIVKDYRTEIGVSFSLLVFFIIMVFASPYFLTSKNMINVISQVAVIGILAIGQTFVILTGGIDLSVGSMMGLSSMITAMSMVRFGILPGILAGIAVGVFMGAVNGTLVGYVKLAPFIVTLGMLSIAKSITYLISNGRSVTSLPEPFAVLTNGNFLGLIPYYMLLVLVLYIVSDWVLKNTKTGRYTYAIGSNEDATRLSGISANLHKAVPYIISGLMASLGAVVQASRLMAVDPNYGSGFELDTIAAVVIGGAVLDGGKGTLVGTAIGVFFMGFLRNGLDLIGVSPYWQGFAVGSVIILALVIQKVSNRIK